MNIAERNVGICLNLNEIRMVKLYKMKNDV